MKRIGHLLEKISDRDNLRLAFTKAVRGKQERKDVVLFRKNFEQNIGQLSRQLRSGSVVWGDYRFFHVRDPKKRLICAASFFERVLHHAIMNICEPALENFAIFDSYACRVNKGVRKAVYRCQSFAGESQWYLKMDIHKYFDSIHHHTVLSLLERRFKDKDLIRLFGDLLNSYCVTPGCGVPIGNLISQHLANYYLGFLDHWLKEERRIKRYLRYMDDFVIFADSKGCLKKEFQRIQVFLDKHLLLQVKDDWSLDHTGNGVPYLGFHIFPGYIKLSKRSKMRFKEKFRYYEWLRTNRVWTEEESAAHVNPLIEFTRTANSSPYRRNMLERYGVMS